LFPTQEDAIANRTQLIEKFFKSSPTRPQPPSSHSDKATR
jgi:hypothetical protein